MPCHESMLMGDDCDGGTGTLCEREMGVFDREDARPPGIVGERNDGDAGRCAPHRRWCGKARSASRAPGAGAGTAGGVGDGAAAGGQRSADYHIVPA